MSNIVDIAKKNPFSSPFMPNSQKQSQRKIAFAAAAAPSKPGGLILNI
jgi:hypothetical protein